MNILFFLTPKSEVAYVEETDTLRQALEKMEHHGYAAVPLLSTEGKYLGTLTDGDVLWGLKKTEFSQPVSDGRDSCHAGEPFPGQ